MQRLTISVTISLALILFAAFPGFAAEELENKGTVVQLATSGPVTSPVVINYRWADLAQNVYDQTYIDTYSYDNATVMVTYETGEPTFTGRLLATNLKPNFAYQIKLVGKPEALFPTTGDDDANEYIGYAGRWWEVAPGTGNRNDAYYEANKNNPDYIFEAYLLFDFFLTDSNGSVDLEFALDSSYHVLFWEWQGSQGSCDHPMKETTVLGSAAHDAYGSDVGPTDVGVYPQIERLCNGSTALPQGNYKCRILITEESFHTTDGTWAPAMINNDLDFNIGAGLFPPPMNSEPAFTSGDNNTLYWNSVAGATQYYVECSTESDFTTPYANSGWTPSLSHMFSGLAHGQIYYYRVKAGDGAKTESSWSSTVSSTQDALVPVSSVDPLPASHIGNSLAIDFTASDAISGVDFVELHYRVDQGTYIQYGGTFSASPINFIIPGDGSYDFYTMAVDKAGNEELAPTLYDASCVLTAGAAPDPVGNPDYVNIGTLESENQAVMGDSPHNMDGWGPTAPGTIGGNYGGIAPESCRPVWSPTEFDLPHEPWADIDLNFGPAGGEKVLWVRYLDGASTDDQSYYLDGNFLDSIETGDAGENWYWYSFDVTGYDGYHTLRIEATEPEGQYWQPFGQVAIDILSVCGASALFEAQPVDAAPIACGESKEVNFHFTKGCEYIRGYALRVSSSDGLTFDDSHVSVLNAGGFTNVTSLVSQNAANDWTITYSIIGDEALPQGIPSDSDLFTIDFQGTSDGTGQVNIESVTVDPLFLVPPPVLDSIGAAVTVDCAAPVGSLQINGGAAATNDLDVNLNSAVTDATPMEMRFINDVDSWGGPEDGWVEYSEMYFWTLTSGPDGSRTVNAEYRDAMGLVLATNASITFTTNGPAPVTQLTAEPGNLEIVVSWQDPPDIDIVSVEVWRGLWYDEDQDGASAYPEYGNLSGSVIPTRPASRAGAYSSTQWDLAGTVPPGEETFTDVDGQGGLPRGIYYYEVFAFDASGFYGPRATVNDRATSYLLGDQDGDGAITVGPDITGGLSLCYGTSDDDPGFDNNCDVGPTDDYSGSGIPLPDDAIEFSDLMIFALNFDTVFTKIMDNEDTVAQFAWNEIETDTWSLILLESCANLKGLNLKGDVSPGAVLSVSIGGLVAGQGWPVFLRNIDSNGLDTGLALLGDGAQIQGEGELLRVTLAPGQVPSGLTIDSRDFNNLSVPSEIAITSGISETPVMHRAFPNYPNPFNPTTRIEFELPVTEIVELSVYGLDGRQIITLVEGALPPGRHAVIWSGCNGQGETVASGTYVYRLKAGAYTKTYKMTLLK